MLSPLTVLRDRQVSVSSNVFRARNATPSSRRQLSNVLEIEISAPRWHLSHRPITTGSLCSRRCLSHGLVAVALGLATTLVTGAVAVASEGSLGILAQSLSQTEEDKGLKTAPADLPVLAFGGGNEFQGQPSAPNSGLEVTTATPEASLLPDENSVPAMVEPMLAESTEGEIEFEPPHSAQLAGAAIADPTTLPVGDHTVADLATEPTVTGETAIAQGSDSAADIPWRFTVKPFFYIPVGINGEITVRDISASIDAGPGDIFDAIVNDLNFAAFGEIEAWKGPWGIFFNGAYANLGTGRTDDIPVPPQFQEAGFPPQVTVDAAVGTSFAQFDLGGAYRFGDANLPMALRTADTEFDLGPFIFDAFAGMRLYTFNNTVELTGQFGNRLELDQSRTIVEPMIGGRARWNVSDHLAALAGGSMSGFGLGDLTFSVAGYGGIDWLFSGNTSLTALYRFTYLDYSSGSSGLDLFTHGPNLGVKFRF